MEKIELPCNELLVVRISSCEPAPPVNGKTNYLHGGFIFPAEVFDDLFRRLYLFQGIKRYLMKLVVHPDRFRVFFLYLLCKPYDRGSCGMKTHWEKNIETQHPFITCYYVPDGESAGMACMKVAVEIWVRDSNKKFFPAVRFWLEYL